MHRSLVGTLLGCVLLSAAGVAQADEVHLVGGAQLEGKATRHGDQVVLEMESGQITLSAESVERIDHRQSTVQQYEAKESKLRPGDVRGLMELADFCRDHDMRSREKELLQRVIATDSDQSDARARLGYVKSGSGWITRDEQLRAQGFVQRDGQWMSPERAFEMDQLHAQASADKARAELEAKKLDLERQQAQLETQRAQDEQTAAALQQPPYYYGVVPGYGYGAGYGYAPAAYAAPCRPGARCSRAVPLNETRPFPIAGVRNPRDTSWPLNGVRNPRSY